MQHGKTMLTKEQIKVYAKYHGDDTRITASEGELVDGDSWTMIDNLISEIWRIRNGVASEASSQELRNIIKMRCKSQEAIDELIRVSCKYWVRMVYDPTF